MIIEAEAHPISVVKGVVHDSSAQLISYMEKYGIDRAIILPGGGPNNIPGSLLEELTKKEPGRFIPFCRFNYAAPVPTYELPVPTGGWIKDKEGSLAEMKQMLQSGVFKGVGEYNIVEMGIEDLQKSVKAYYPFMDEIAKFKVPAQFHTGFGTGMSKNLPMGFFDPVNIDDLASRYPDIPFIVNHCGGMIPPLSDTTLYMAAKNENIFLIISHITLMRSEQGKKAYTRFIEEALQSYGVGADRLIFSSDWQARHDTNGLCGAHHEVLKTIKMSESERNMIMGDNMRKLLKI